MFTVSTQTQRLTVNLAFSNSYKKARAQKGVRPNHSNPPWLRACTCDINVYCVYILLIFQPGFVTFGSL